MTPTRRDFVRQGGWAVAAACAPADAQQATQAPGSANRLLSLDVERTLMACAEAITGVRPLRGHYLDYWRYHAVQRPGRRDLYARFADTVIASAALAGVADFASADLPARAVILEALRARPDTSRDFEDPVFQEIIAVFQRTDAWLQLGYAAWPGSARGLDEYRHAPASPAPR